jgi:Concanavalin A-like lectin/glucanases superfamily
MNRMILLAFVFLLLLVSSVLAFSTLLTRAEGTSYTQPSGLVGYWNFDQGSGTIADDSSGYNNQGTIYGASWTSGKINGALSFDGLDDYVDCGNSETLDPTQGATIEAWVKFDQLPSVAGHIMAIAGRSGMGTDLDLQTEQDNKFKFFIGPGAPIVAVSNTVVETNKWYHIAGTYQANNNMKIYVNGALEQTISINLARNTNPNKFGIGQSLHWADRFFDGTIDEVKIFNRPLSEEEIEAEYIQVSISPSSKVMSVGQSQQFSSSVSGGTSPYTYQWYLNNASVSGATSASWTFTTETSGSYTIHASVHDATGALETSNTATVTVNPVSAPVPSATTAVTVSNNSATVDQLAATGVSITINGSSLQDGTQLNVTSTNYGDNQPEGTGELQVDTPVFYAVDVNSDGEALNSDVSGAMSFSNPSFNSASVIEYWNGSIWAPVATTFTAPDTVSCIISAISAQLRAQAAIPASVLTGTPILVGNPKSSATASPLSATSLSIIIAIVVVIVVVLGVLFVYVRKRKAK